MDYALAIDIGASGGRHILGYLEDGELVMEEVYRFANGYKKENNSLVWDTADLYNEVAVGIKKCASLGKIPKSIGIDTWGVDYVLVDKNGVEILPAYAYRDDRRTLPFIDTVIPFNELYKKTGIAFNSFNTVYQLLADKKAGRLLHAANFFLMPEYLSFKLTGSLKDKASTEYTDASTTGLLDANKKDWDYDIIDKLGLPRKIFAPVQEPPYVIGSLSEELQKEFGFGSTPDIMMIASHDTASAVSTINANDNNSVYISSGTWSLLGIISGANLTDMAREANYTNEGAHNGKIRFLKNIMGLWMLQNIRRELGETEEYKDITFSQLETLARGTGNKTKNGDAANYFIDVNGQQFISPPSMINAIKDECKRLNNAVPQSAGELAYCVYTSLAKGYDIAIRDLEKITMQKYDTIIIIGGGSKDMYLNELTEKFTGKKVTRGLIEATAAGNLLLQLNTYKK